MILIWVYSEIYLRPTTHTEMFSTGLSRYPVVAFQPHKYTNLTDVTCELPKHTKPYESYHIHSQIRLSQVLRRRFRCAYCF